MEKIWKIGKFPLLFNLTRRPAPAPMATSPRRAVPFLASAQLPSWPIFHSLSAGPGRSHVNALSPLPREGSLTARPTPCVADVAAPPVSSISSYLATSPSWTLPAASSVRGRAESAIALRRKSPRPINSEPPRLCLPNPSSRVASDLAETPNSPELASAAVQVSPRSQSSAAAAVTIVGSLSIDPSKFPSGTWW